MKTTRYTGHLPFVRILIVLIMGIVLGRYLPASAGVMGILQTSVLALSVLFFCLLFLRLKYRASIREWMGATFLLFLFVFGMLSMVRLDPNVQSDHFSNFEAAALQGIVVDVDESDRFVRVSLAVNTVYTADTRRAAMGRLQLSVRKADLDLYLRYGDEIRIPADYRAITPAYNPDQFDYKDYLWSRNIHHQLFLDSYQVEMLRADQGNFWIARARALRERMIQRIGRFVHDPDAMAIASALVLGERSNMRSEVEDAFSKTGTVHVLSVSGLHVGMVFFVGTFLLSWLGNGRHTRVIKTVLLLALIWGYAMLTGFSASVLRAAIMLSFAIIGMHVRKANIYNSICASATLLLLFNPKFIYHIGFQLSYLAVLGIIYLYPKLNALSPVKNRVVSWLWGYIVVSVAAQIAVSPLVMYYFDNFPLYFLPANLFILLPATLILYGGFLLTLLPSGSSLDTVGRGYEQGIIACKDVLQWIEQWPHASLEMHLPFGEVILLYLLFILGALYAIQKPIRLNALFTGLLIWVLYHSIGQIAARSTDEIRLYNVQDNLAIGLFSSRKSILYTDLPSWEESRLRFAVYPHFKRHVRSEGTLVHHSDTYETSFLWIARGLIQWGDRRLLIYDGTQQYDYPWQVDLLLIRDNARQSLVDLRHQIAFAQVVVDGSNSDKTVQRFVQEARALSIPLYVLKNNFSYVWKR